MSLRLFPYPTSGLSSNSSQFCHSPPGDSVRAHRLRAHPHGCPDLRHQSKPRLSPGLLTYKLARGQRSQQHLLIELGETFYLLDHWFLTKSTRSSQVENVHRTGCGEVTWSSRVLSLRSSPCSNTCSPTSKLSESCSSERLWRLHYVGVIDYIIGHW